MAKLPGRASPAGLAIKYMVFNENLEVEKGERCDGLPIKPYLGSGKAFVHVRRHRRGQKGIVNLTG
jgi:hypothetical protein